MGTFGYDEYSRTLEHLAKPFVESGIYESTDAFVGDLLKDVASRKIKAYERKIKKFEAKYGSFEQFSEKIRGKATPWQEDQWMERGSGNKHAKDLERCYL